MPLPYRYPLFSVIVWGLSRTGSFANAFGVSDDLGTPDENQYGLVTAALTVCFAEHEVVTTMEDSKISSTTSLQILPPSPTVRITESINVSRSTDLVSTVSTTVAVVSSHASMTHGLSTQISTPTSRTPNAEPYSANWTISTQTATTSYTNSPDRTTSSVTADTANTGNCRCAGANQIVPSSSPTPPNGSTMMMFTPQTTCVDHNHSNMKGSATIIDLYSLFGITIPFWVTGLISIL